jgi:hypothetical protein
MHKPAPNKTIVGAAWETVKGAATISGCTDLVAKVGGFIVELMQRLLPYDLKVSRSSNGPR